MNCFIESSLSIPLYSKKITDFHEARADAYREEERRRKEREREGKREKEGEQARANGRDREVQRRPHLGLGAYL